MLTCKFMSKGSYHKPLRKIVHAICRVFFFFRKKFIEQNNVFIIFARNIACRYMLESPRRGSSNENPQSMFWIKNKKIGIPLPNPSFDEKVGYEGIYFSWRCFLKSDAETSF